MNCFPLLPANLFKKHRLFICNCNLPLSYKKYTFLRNVSPSPEEENHQPTIDANTDKMSTKINMQETCSPKPETETIQMENINPKTY